MKLMVVMLDTWRTSCAIQHENSFLPYGRRIVEIELTPDQAAALAPRKVGEGQAGKFIYEDMGDVWIEPTPPATTGATP
jgi:hypothetical protein